MKRSSERLKRLREIRMKSLREKRLKRLREIRMKSLREKEITRPSRVNRTTGYHNDNRGDVGEISKPSAPATSVSTAEAAAAAAAGAEGSKRQLTNDEALAFLKKRSNELKTKRARENEIPGPSRVNRAPATSVSTTDNGTVRGARAGAKPQLTFDEALAFVHLVKDTFKDSENKHRDFTRLVQDWRVGRIDRPVLITRVNELFKGHPELVHGFMAYVRR